MYRVYLHNIMLPSNKVSWGAWHSRWTCWIGHFKLVLCIAEEHYNYSLNPMLRCLWCKVATNLQKYSTLNLHGHIILNCASDVATPLWVKWEAETPTPKVGDLGSSETPECLEFDSRGQNTSHWGVIGKVLKCKCLKCPRIGHLDICSPSYGQKKGRESNWQFDSRPLKVGNQPLPDVQIESATRRWKDLDEGYNFGLDPVAIRLCSRELWAPKVPRLQPG